MANRFSPTVLPRAPSLSIFRDELEATRNRPTTLQRLGQAIGAFNDTAEHFSERDVRHKVLDEQEQNEGFGAALGRVATASLDRRKAGTSAQAEPGIPTRLGSFDAESGRFLRPDDNVPVRSPGGGGTPGFNPNDPAPITERIGLGASGAGLEDIPIDRSRADEAIRRHQRIFGDTDDIVAERERGRKLAQAISVLRQSGATQEEIGLLEAGIIDPSDVLSRADTRDDERQAEAQQRAAFNALNRANPQSYPEFIPGFDYAGEVAKFTDDSRALAKQDDQQAFESEQNRFLEGGRNSRAALNKAPAPPAPGTATPEEQTRAFSMLSRGMDPSAAVQILVSQGVTPANALQAVKDAKEALTGKAAPEQRELGDIGLKGLARDITSAALATENPAADALARLNRMDLTKKERAALEKLIAENGVF